MSVRVQLVGPLTVRDGDVELVGTAIAGARERRLLAILAVAAGEVVDRDAIVERLWDRPPRDPVAAVDTAVSLLRRALGPAAEAIETRRPGYRMAASTDLAEAADHVAAGRWDDALALVDGGELMAGERPTEWVETQRREHARRVIDMMVHAGAAGARRGDDELAIERFAAAIRSDPLREDAQRGLIAALARSGRQAEAVRAYERCRRTLRDELGIDPAPETVAVFEQVLVGGAPDAGRRPAATAGAAGRPVTIPFLGRRRELARLTSPDGRAVRVVLGEPGIGKSRLLAEATSASDRAVRATKCFRLVSPVPYAVLADLAPGLVDPIGAAGDVGGTSSGGTSSGGTSSGGTSSGGTSIGGTGHTTAGWRWGAEALASRLAARFAAQLGDEPTALVVDDLQWADEPSLAVLGLLLRRRPAGLLVLAAARDTELDPSGPARQLLALCDSLGILDVVQLGPLAAEDVLAGGFTFEDWRRSGGVPLLFGELRAGRTDDDLAVAVVARAEAAGAEAVDVVRAAAILDRPARVDELAALALMPLDAARAAADRAAAAGMLVAAGGAWRIRHDVFAELVRAELDPTVAVAWHGRALEMLARSADPAELAHHALAAGDRPALVRHSLAAGERALAAFANREAVTHFTRVLDGTVDDTDDGTVRRKATIGCAKALIVLGRTDDAAELLTRLAPASGADEVERLLLEADCGWAAWRPSMAIPPARRALELATELARELGTDEPAASELLGRVHAFIANPYGSLGELEQARFHVAAALDIASRAGRPPPAVVLYRLGIIRHQTGDELGALDALDRCRELAMEQHDERTLVFERVVRSWSLGALGRYGEALQAIDDVDRIGRGEEAVVRGRVPNTRASLLFDLGLAEAALDADLESLEILRDASGAQAVNEPRIHTLINLATDHLALGDPDRAAQCLAEAEALSVDAEYARFRYMNRLHWVRGLLVLEAGDVEGALGEADTVAAMADRYDAPRYRVRASMLKAMAHGRRGDTAAALDHARTAARIADRHALAALAERAHRLAAEHGGGARHERAADRLRAAIVASVGEPLRDRLSRR